MHSKREATGKVEGREETSGEWEEKGRREGERKRKEGRRSIKGVCVRQQSGRVDAPELGKR